MAGQIRIQNLAEFQASLRAAQARVQDLTQPLTEIGLDWLRQNKTIFEGGGNRSFADLSGGRSRRDRKGRFRSPNGGYKAQKLRRWGFIYPILRASGRLERSITEAGAPGQIFTLVGGSRIQLGTSVRSRSGADYPRFLNDGTRVMPARRFLSISELTSTRWRRLLEDFVAGAVGSPGRTGSG
jgi:hypothetical protein